MVVSSIVLKSQLEGAKRLDAEYYQPEYLEVTKRLQSVPHKTLQDVSEKLVSFGAYSLTSVIEWQESGIPFITAENIKDGFIDYDGVRYISEKVDEVLKKSRVKEGQVLLAMSGSVGNAAVAVDIPERLNSNQDIVKITPRVEISPYVLAAFLNSRYGRMQVLRLPVGSIQQHIFLWQMQTLLIPMIERGNASVIEQIYKDGLSALAQSKSLYSQAEQTLLQELGLEDFEEDGELWSVVQLSESQVAHRMDAEYFQPKYAKLFRQLEKRGARPLGELVTIKKGVEPGSEAYADEGKPFIRVSNVSIFGLADKDQKYVGDQLYQEMKNDYAPKVGEILLTKDATLGIACVLTEKVEGIVSGGVLRLKLKESMKDEYLALCINSLVGRLQAERDAGGSIIAHWKPEQIKQVLIPVLPVSAQQNIAELVRASHAARAKARELLEEAKHTVEDWIESRQKNGGHS